MLVDKRQVDDVGQAVEQLRPMTDDPRVDDELILVDEPELREGEGELQAADKEAVAPLSLQFPNGSLKVGTADQLGVPVR